MKSNYSASLKSTFVAILAAVANSSMANEGNNNRGHRGPPPEAIEACSNASVDQACQFTGRRGETLSGTCFSVGENDSQGLACKPTNGGPSGRDQDQSQGNK